MKQFDSITFTEKEMKEMCDYVNHHSLLELISEDLDLGRVNKDIERLVCKGYSKASDTLQQGVKIISYEAGRVVIHETPFQYPHLELIAAIDAGKEDVHLVGPMTGVFAHVFQKDVYVAQVRGQEISAPGKIQIVAGMGDYGLYPADTALKEVREEIGLKNPQLVLDRNRFLDVTPFMKSGRFPQPIFSYIVTGNFDYITPIIRNNSELVRFEASLPKEKPKEAYPFIIPLENLRDFFSEVDALGKFYGPVKRTGDSFLDWYNQTFNRNY